MKYRQRVPLSLARTRAAITNGTTLLGSDIDHRSPWMRRLRDLIVAHTNDLGGESEVSEAESRLIRRAAMLNIQLEMYDAKFACRDDLAAPSDLETYQRLTNTLRRTLDHSAFNGERKMSPRRWPSI